MEEVKLIKMRCRKTGKFFCLEQKNGLVVNMIELSEADADKISTSPSVGTGLKTAPNLLPCLGCRSRNVGGCACAQTAKRKCNPKDKYNFQCVYCRELELIPAKAAMPKIYVTSPHYDDIAQVLDTMGLRHSPYRSRLDCDIFFINCGTNDAVDTAALRSFVENGGCVYISDLAYSHLVGAFPGYLEFDNSGGDEGRLTATVEDNELRNIVGQEIEVEFDLGAWAIIRNCRNTRVLLRAKRNSPYGPIPLMVSFDCGKGKVFYTSFHNHAQASEKETMLLQLLLLKQIGSKSGQTVEQVGELVGLNISTMRSKFRA